MGVAVNAVGRTPGVAEPGPADVERAIADLQREASVGALATVGPTGAPSVAAMHIAADGLVVYFHTFTDTRKCAAIHRDRRVAYTQAHEPQEGLDAARELRAVQVEGRASFVHDAEEIQLAVRLSKEQFPWLRDSHLYDNMARAVATGRQVFIRVDPVQALWTDNRVRMLWRRLITFTPDGPHVADMTDYPPPSR
jgi:nitroimidazol reductase NimA-like FMN-containing flavoprotein (pyridoxamine 5'-phosphate oxidase superfamily)